MTFLLDHVEYLVLAVNTVVFAAFLYRALWYGDSWGKVQYWGGTIILVSGLIRMKG